MDRVELKDIDSEDLEDMLLIIEKSFNIGFVTAEIAVETFGELCDCIVNKINLRHEESCTTQQAFYKLSKVVAEITNSKFDQISPSTVISEVFPEQIIVYVFKLLEKSLDIKFNILYPSKDFNKFLWFISISSIPLSVFFWKSGLSLLVLSTLMLWFWFRTKQNLLCMTFGELAVKMTRNNYLKSRRNSNSINKNEIENILTAWFIDDFDLDETKLNRQSQFSWSTNCSVITKN